MCVCVYLYRHAHTYTHTHTTHRAGNKRISIAKFKLYASHMRITSTK